jgi:hypothetical protein
MNLSQINKLFFGPLSSEFCIYFYIISMTSLLSIFFVCIPAIVFGLKTKEKSSYYISILGLSIMYLIGYVTNRLLYTMCKSSTKQRM